MSKQDLDVFDDLLGAAPSAASPAPNGRGHASLQPPPASALRVASERAKAFSDSLGFDFLDAPAPPSGPMPMTRGLPPPPPPPSLVRKSVAAAPAPSIPLPQPASTRGPAPPPGKLRLPSPAYLADEADDLDAEFDADELKLETELDALNPMPLVASRPTLPDRRTASGALSASLSTMIEEELGVDSPGDLDLDEGLDGLDPLMGAEPLLSSAATQGSARPVLAPPPPSRIARTVPSAQMELPAPKSVPRSSAPKSLEPPPPPPPFSQDQAMSLGALPPPPVVPDYDDRPGEGDFGHEPTNVYGSRALRSVQLPLPPLPQPMLPPISPPSVRIGPGTAPMSFPPRSSTAPVVSEARPFSMAAPGTGSKSRQLLLAASQHLRQVQIGLDSPPDSGRSEQPSGRLAPLLYLQCRRELAFCAHLSRPQQPERVLDYRK